MLQVAQGLCSRICCDYSLMLTGVESGGGGMQWIWHPNNLYGGYWYVYPQKNRI